MFYRIISVIFLSAILLFPQEKTKMNFTMDFFKATLGDVDIKDADAALKLWIKTYKEKLEKNLRQEIIFDYTIHESYNILQSKEFYSKCNFMNLSSIEFIKFNTKNEFEAILTGSNSDNIFTEYLIIANKNSAIKNIKDLKGVSILLPNRNSNDIVEIWLNVLLHENRMPRIENYFSKIIESRSNVFSVNSVFFRSYDCAIISKSSLELAFELNPQLRNNIKVLLSSEPYITNIMAVKNDMEDTIKKLISDIGISLINDPDGHQFLSLFRIYDIKKITNNDLKNVSNTLKKYIKYFGTN